MDRKQWVLQLAVVLAVGFIGGAVSSRFFPHTVVQTRYMPEQGKVIQAEEFRLVDSKGNPRARLMVEDTGPGLIFFSNQENRMLELGLSKNDDPVLNFLNGSGKQLISMGLVKNKQSNLVFYDSRGKQRVVLIHFLEGSSAFSFLDDSEEPCLMFVLDPDGTGGFSLQDKRLKPRIGMVSGKHKKAGITIINENGDVLWKVP